MERQYRGARRTARRSTCAKCFVLTTMATFFLIGLSVLGTTVYIEIQWSDLKELNSDYFSKFVWVYIFIGVTVITSGLLTLISSCFEKGRITFGIVIFLLAVIGTTALCATFVLKPWNKVPEFANAYRQEHGGQIKNGDYQKMLDFFNKLEENYLCCNQYNKSFTQTGEQILCGPIKTSQLHARHSKTTCRALFVDFNKSHHTRSGRPLYSASDIVEACKTPCPQRMLETYRTYFFSLVFQTLLAVLVQVVTFIFLIAEPCSSVLRRRFCPDSSSARCRFSCDVLGNMCACGCTCIKSENTFEDTVPITPMESPPPYTDPVPEVVDDLINLDVLADGPASSGLANIHLDEQMESTQL